MSKTTETTAAMAALSIDDFVDIQATDRIDLPDGEAGPGREAEQWSKQILNVLTISDLPSTASLQPVTIAALERTRSDIARGIVSNMVARKPFAIEEITPHVLVFRVILAAFEGNIAALKALLVEDVDAWDQRENLIKGALFMAVRKGRVDAINALLDEAGDVDLDVKNMRDTDGRTAVCHATEHMQDEVLRVLLKAGAQVNTKARDGRTALHRVASNDSYESEVKILMEFGADINELKSNGEPELYCAAAGGDVDAVRTLLRRGADPSRTTVCRWCPLHWAANNGYIEVVKLLVEAGANVNNRSDTGRTPLDLVVQHHWVEDQELADRLTLTREYLIAHGATSGHPRW